MTIGAYIKKFRQKNSLTQAAFANIIGTDKQTISKWEREAAVPDAPDVPDIKYLYEIARVTGLGMHFLTNPELLEKCDIPRKRAAFNVGLNTFYKNVHDVKTFCYFIDTLSKACDLVTPRMGLIGFLFPEYAPDAPDFDPDKDLIGVQRMVCDIEQESVTLHLTKSHGSTELNAKTVLSIKPYACSNNEVYGFEIKCIGDEQPIKLDAVIVYE